MASACISQEIFNSKLAPAGDNRSGPILDVIQYQIADNSTAIAEASSDLKFPNTVCPTTGTTFRLRGRFDADALGTTQSRLNEATFGELGNVVGVRRAWIGAEGNLAIGGRYITEIDVASGNVVIR